MQRHGLEKSGERSEVVRDVASGAQDCADRHGKWVEEAGGVSRERPEHFAVTPVECVDAAKLTHTVSS